MRPGPVAAALLALPFGLLAAVPQPGRVLALQADRSSGFTRVVIS